MRRAFTLIELLVVMAITAVMMTLIVLPIFQSFNLTRQAQAFADAQDKARLLTEKIAREVGNAISVRDSASTIAQLPNVDPVTLKPNGTVRDITLPYTKLDLIPPAQGAPYRDPATGVISPGVFVDPVTGKVDPTLTRPKGDIRLPVAPGATLVRWSVGLKDPTRQYNEPYTGLLMARNGDGDNLFVLRRAEVQPFVLRNRKDGVGPAKWRPNLAFFHSDDDRGDGGEFDTRIIDLDDPYFFVRDGMYQPEGGGPRVADPEKNNRVDQWVKHSVIQTEVSRYDMVRPAVKGSPPKVDPSAPNPVVPLIQFRPTRVSSAPASGTAAARPGESVDGLDRIGPDTYQTQQGLWTNAIIRYYPQGYLPGGALEVASIDEKGAANIGYGQNSGDGLDGGHAAPDNFTLFDLKQYEQVLGRGERYPFTKAALAADFADLISNPSPARRWTPEVSQRQIFTPFRVFTATGKLVTSFPIEEVGFTNLANPNQPNLPFVTTTSQYAVSAAQASYVDPATSTAADPGLSTAPLSPLTPGYDLNRAFNRVFTSYPALQGTWQRFIDLRFVPNADGTYSPLNPTAPDASTGKITGFSFNTANGGALNRVRIVPGSDEVYGPDQTTTGTYASIVRYTRVTGNPGPNQYKLVYADLPEPTDSLGNVDYSVLGINSTLLGGFNPQAYDANDVVSAMIQPRFKAGYLQLCSDPNVPIPAGSITVRYRFQFNGPGDTFAVDLDTREVMQILLTIKNYPQSNVPNAQSITLKSTATLRNALR